MENTKFTAWQIIMHNWQTVLVVLASIVYSFMSNDMFLVVVNLAGLYMAYKEGKHCGYNEGVKHIIAEVSKWARSVLSSRLSNTESSDPPSVVQEEMAKAEEELNIKL